MAAEFATAVADRTAPALTGTARLRALLPTGLVEAHGRTDIAAFLAGVLAGFDTVELLASAGEDVADRLLVHYRLGLGQGRTRWVCTQTAVCKVVDGHFAVIDLLCSGFREVDLDERARLVG